MTTLLGCVALQVPAIHRLADRMARTSWALLVKGGVYRSPAAG